MFKKLHNYFLPLIICCGVFLASLIIIWAVLNRNFTVDTLKKEFNKIIYSLNMAGYDIAYDYAEFTSFSPSQIVEFQNFKLYKIGMPTDFELVFPQLILSADLLNAKKLTFDISHHFSFTLNNIKKDIFISDFLLSMRFDKKGLNNLIGKINNLAIDNLLSIDAIQFATQRSLANYITNNSTFVENFIECRNIHLNKNSFPNLPSSIEEVYFNLNILGKLQSKLSYQDTLKDWIDNNGSLEINKFILNWKPLVLVSRGSINLDNYEDPYVKLITTSKGLIEFLDIAETAGIFNRKNVFVSKILLSNKIKQNLDQSYTIITPMTLSPNKISIDGAPLWENKI